MTTPLYQMDQDRDSNVQAARSEKDAQAGETAIPTRLMHSDPAGDRVNILLVDDRKENLVALEAILEELGENLVSVGSGQEALRMILQHEFAVILLDVNLPGMNGFETASIIRSRDQSRHIPIIFLTAMSSTEAQEFAGYSVGAVDYIIKPIEPDILRTKVRVFIDLHKKTRALNRLNEELEDRVRQRTTEIDLVNSKLRKEIAERMEAEERIRALNSELEARVRSRTAELEKAYSELESFSYAVSHDLRAPLRKIQTLSEMLLNECGTGLSISVKELIERIASSNRQMTEIIDNMLELSRVAREEIGKTPVDLSAMVSGIAKELQQTDPERKAVFEIEGNITVLADPGLLRIAIQNLMENAWKFSSKRPETRIAFGVATNNGRNEFFLKDNGVGFAQKDEQEVFRIFKRVHSSSDFPGTGIGLAIVQRVINRHGGTIRVESAIDRGTCFYFTLSDPDA